MLKRTIFFVGSAVFGANLLFAGASLRGDFSAAGAAVAKSAKYMASGWSIGQSSITIGHRTSVSNENDADGFWRLAWFAVPPPPPAVLAPVYIEPGNTGWIEIVETNITIYGYKSPDFTYGHDTLVCSFPKFSFVQQQNQTSWLQNLTINVGESLVMSYSTSNNFGRSKEDTILTIDCVPEASGLIAICFFGLLAFGLKFKRFGLAAFFLILVFNFNAYAESIKINYQGIVEVDGAAHVGPAYFKFAIRENDTLTNLWSNDGALLGEPNSSFQTYTSNGVFNALLGDIKTIPLQSEIFQNRNQLYFFVWFSQFPVQNFELLSDAQPITFVPYAANTFAIGNLTENEIATTQSIAVLSNYFSKIISSDLDITNLFLLKTGDVCSGELRVSNLVSDVNIVINAENRVQLNGESGGTYLKCDSQGNATIFKNNKPIFEIE